jgi:ethanolamine ammonia-lyase small subunit
MTKPYPSIKTQDEWKPLTKLTSARIALGRAGMSLTTNSHLAFQLAHSQARDAVNIDLDYEAMQNELSSGSISSFLLHSQVLNRAEYLQRPDKGRMLDQESVSELETFKEENGKTDIVIVVADGLSSFAVEHHAASFLQMLISALEKQEYKIAPVCLVKQGRVAVGDHVGEILGAKMVVLLIGERPGLSSPDSMGIYFIYQPKVGATDAERNCISNIHSNGLSYEEALQKVMYLIHESQRLKLSGVNLKEGFTGDDVVQIPSNHKNFLLEL